jgi:hypothetical protein
VRFFAQVRGDARVGEYKVDPAEFGDAVGHYLPKPVEVTDVALVCDDAPTSLLNEVDGFVEVFWASHRIGHTVDLVAQVQRDDVCAFLGETHSVRASLSPRRSGYESNLALKLTAHGAPVPDSSHSMRPTGHNGGRSAKQAPHTRGHCSEVLRSPREGIDTSTATGRMVAGVLASLAELELELGRERRAATRQTRQARGQHIGRPKVLYEKKAALAQRMHANGESASTIAATLNVSRATIYRVLAEQKDDAVG